MKRTLAKILSMALAASLLLPAGCAKTEGSSSSSSGNGSSASDGAVTSQPITLTILKPKVTYDSDYSSMQILQDYEKKTNVTIKWETPDQNDFTTKYQLMMNSGTLPDAIIAMPTDDIEKYGQNGTLIKLNDYISKDMPNLQAVMQKYPESKKIVTCSDGNIYSMPFVYQGRWGNDVMLVRDDWLKKLNLSTPVTTDDWYNVLKAFKTQDPNGNGQADELPFNGANIQVLETFAMAWGFPMVTSTSEITEDFYVATEDKLYPYDGKVHFAVEEDRYKEAVQYMNKLYSEGLVDPEIVSNDTKSYQAKMTTNISGATRGVFGGDMATMNTAAQKAGQTDFHLVAAPVVKGPYGDQIHTDVDPAALANGFAITKSDKYPEETARWADYWYSAQGQLDMLGVKDKTYTITNDGPMFTDYVLKNPDGKTSSEVWGSYTPGRSIWPTVWIPDCACLQFDSQETRDAKQNILTSDKLVEAMPKLSFNADDNDTRKSLLSDITPFVQENLSNFILGKTSFDQWDSFISQLKSMGINDLVQIYQKAYDAYQAK